MSVLSKLMCIRCKEIDVLQETNDKLVCNKCSASYPVINGVPRFVATDDYAKSFGLQWMIHRKTQLDSYTGVPLSRDRLLDATSWPERLEGEVVLEVGSGAGRFTEVLVRTGADIISCDLSSAVEANFKNNGHNSNVLIIQADIASLPVAPHSVDKVLCLGVIQHTPSPESFFSMLARYVKPGGALVLDCYSSRLQTILCWKYMLRPVTRRLDPALLYRMVKNTVPALLPVAIFLYKVAGRVGYRLMPIQQHAHLGIRSDLLKEWAILDTFDMYAPAHDHPQSKRSVERWFREANFTDVEVHYGLNGIVARGLLSEDS